MSKNQFQSERKSSWINGFKGKAMAFISLFLLLSIGILIIFWIQNSPDSSNSIHDASQLDSLSTNLLTENEEDEKEKDQETELILGTGFEMVKGQCTACHSSALIIQNRFTREGWKEKIEWMQETQGLWDLGESESVILDYLAENYSPGSFEGRRAPLTNIEWYELKD